MARPSEPAGGLQAARTGGRPPVRLPQRGAAPRAVLSCIHSVDMLHRATVLEEIVRILPPEVAERVNKVVDSQHDQHAGIEQVLSRDGARRAVPG